MRQRNNYLKEHEVMPTISLCMIVYNEENNIRRCLESVCGFVDEIIAVDTGSTDRTRAICEEYGTQVFDYEWAEDFSEARNYSVSKASCDWILLLDADEELKIRDLAGLMQYLQNTVYDMVSIHLTHFYGDQPADEKRAHFSSGLRLIRNDGDVRFTGNIHEKVVTTGKSVDHTAETRRLIQILHYGYMEDADKNKTSRNISLLLKEKDKQMGDPWIDYYLAAEYYRLGKIHEAYGEVNAAILLFLLKGSKPPFLVYKLKYDMLIASHYYDTAYKGIYKAIALYPDYVDLHFYKGILEYSHGEYEKARNTLRYCLFLGEMNMEYLILSGSGSFLALHYLGLCHEKQGESRQAAEAFRQVRIFYPEFDSAEIRFKNLNENGPGQISLSDMKA